MLGPGRWVGLYNRSVTAPHSVSLSSMIRCYLAMALAFSSTSPIELVASHLACHLLSGMTNMFLGLYGRLLSASSALGSQYVLWFHVYRGNGDD